MLRISSSEMASQTSAAVAAMPRTRKRVAR
jgi:hypothetical protein